MFKLKRLEITGFKSFADYTEIVFTGNGITAVVGPNGCGKSNVSDCISWVLGEQRAKTLRGGEMKDVVFQGSKNRNPSGMAEVVLHLVRDGDALDIDEGELEDIDETLSSIDEAAVDMDAIELDAVDTAEPPVVALSENGFHESEFEVEKVQAAQVGSTHTVERTVKSKRHWRPRTFALEFAPGEAVSVTRRLYLSGESEYELNGKTCRLRDIQDLFAGTGLSGAHYAIIEQGRIGQILSAKPADRRNLIEEAAGISKFRTRQRAAEARLDSAKSNLSRISDIVSEIDKQANSLRRQASKTRRFIALQDEFRVLLRGLFAAEGQHLSDLIEGLAVQLTAAQKTEIDFAQRVTAQEATFQTATQAARDAEEELTEIRRRHAENALERDRTDREHRYQTEQIVNLTGRLTTLRAGIENDTGRIEMLGEERARLQADEQKENADAAAAELVLREAEDKFNATLDELRQIETDLEYSRGEHLKHATAVERFDEISRQLQYNLERLGERSVGLERERMRADEAFDEHTKTLTRISTEIDGEQKRLDELQTERTEIHEVTAVARENVRLAEAELGDLQTEYSRARHRLETLHELEEKRAVYAPQVQNLFASRDKIGAKLTGVVADFLKVDEQTETALETLFGSYLQAVIVENAEDAAKATRWLSQNEIGRIAVLVVPAVHLKGGDTQGGSGNRIEDHLGISDGFRDVLRRVFPREMSSIIVDDLASPAAVNASAAINHRGEMSIEGSLFIAGRNNGDQKNTSLLAFKRELAGLDKLASELRSKIEIAETKAAIERAALTASEEKGVDLQSLIIKVERGLVSHEAQQTVARQEIERAERHKKVVADEASQMAAEIAEVERRVAEASASMRSAAALRDEAAAGLENIGKLLAEARSRSDAANRVFNEKRTLAATSTERRRAVQSALRRVENEQKELESRITTQNLEITETENKLENLRSSVSDISFRMAAAGSDADREQAELHSAVENLNAARSLADEASRELADLNRRSAEALNHRSSIEVRRTEAVTQLRNVNEKCLQDLNIQLAELVETEGYPDDYDLERERAEADDLRRRLDGFGAINMLAVDELNETEERLQFLTSQRQDIIDSIESTEEALREIKERSRARFKDAFEAINANFIEFFQELFGGGRGEMTLLESDDILEAGIEVVAQPPGKRLQNILLLSGGEKAMTAIALVLAIFKYRPSPFCLLDEVDAPLDDANVGRFVNKIAEMSEKTQFIVITHNKRTMEAARALYGVTMQEAGVSKIVSVKFD